MNRRSDDVTSYQYSSDNLDSSFSERQDTVDISQDKQKVILICCFKCVFVSKTVLIVRFFAHKNCSQELSSKWSCNVESKASNNLDVIFGK